MWMERPRRRMDRWFYQIKPSRGAERLEADGFPAAPGHYSSTLVENPINIPPQRRAERHGRIFNHGAWRRLILVLVAWSEKLSQHR